jgi:hypothetical protein
VQPLGFTEIAGKAKAASSTAEDKEKIVAEANEY